MVFLTRQNVRAKIDCPRVPNFIKVDGNYKELGYLSDKDLEIVADEWKMHLLDRARQQRKE